MKALRSPTAVLAPRTDPVAIRVLTWNIHCGQDGGPRWKRFNWSRRKAALAAALRDADADVVCVQEARAEQVEFLESLLPTHRRAGVGRGGGMVGEHCAIFFSRDRFTLLDSGTFWLKEPCDVPGCGSLLGLKRICTWVRLRDGADGRCLRVYNTHSYLTEGPRRRAARLILDRMATGDSTDGVVLCGDFNAPPTAASRRVFSGVGLADSAVLAGKFAPMSTFHWRGIPLRALDAILVSPAWQVRGHVVLDVKPGNTWPSDHFGVVADLVPRDGGVAPGKKA
jgi:endonuclease/exonuclease/phosphatase family metal-dependent hydrolase